MKYSLVLACLLIGVSCSQTTPPVSPPVALGHCNQAADCTGNDKPVCDLTNNICVACSSTNAQLGDQQCGAWKTVQVDPLARGLCINGACAECRTSADCTQRIGKNFCDQTDNTCKGCTKNSQCVGSNICKLDESLLATGDLLSQIGECVLMKDVALVDNNPAVCDSAAAGGKPFCEVSQAIALSGKSYISVRGNGGTTATTYQSVTLATSGQRVAIIGPGRDVPYSTQQAVLNGVTVSGGAQITLVGIALSNNGGLPTLQCSGSSTVYVQNVLISTALSTPKGGIYANNCSKVTVEKTKISGVPGYGLFITGGSGHRVVNNAFINGGSASDQAGLRLAGGATGLFAFNTIAGFRQGVICDSPATISDSIITMNISDPQVIGSCQQMRIVTTGVTLDPNYMNASEADPKLIMDTNNLCIDKGMPDANRTIKDDFYGSPRPQGSGYDIGFQEVR